jgi:AbrB family looped-hinge helix DNA binding protein
MSTSNVTQKGQVTIPAEMRKALGLKAGSKVRFSRRGRKVCEQVEEPAADSLFGTFKVSARGIADIDAAWSLRADDPWRLTGAAAMIAGIDTNVLLRALR